MQTETVPIITQQYVLWNQKYLLLFHISKHYPEIYFFNSDLFIAVISSLFEKRGRMLSSDIIIPLPNLQITELLEMAMSGKASCPIHHASDGAAV